MKESWIFSLCYEYINLLQESNITWFYIHIPEVVPYFCEKMSINNVDRVLYSWQVFQKVNSRRWLLITPWSCIHYSVLL